jgi:predicted HAD superfamily Cof-like phosphohydrolase
MDTEGVMWEYYNIPTKKEGGQMSVMHMVEDFAFATKQENKSLLYLTLIDEEYKEWVESDSREEELKELADLVYVIYGYCSAMNHDLDKAIRRVKKNSFVRLYHADDVSLEYGSWEKVEFEKDEPKFLADLVYVIYGYANSKGYDLDEALRRVHANNLGRCIQPDGSILRREDGKIIKNKDYPKVELGDLV